MCTDWENSCVSSVNRTMQLKSADSQIDALPVTVSSEKTIRIYASFWRRAAATLIDTLIISALQFGLLGLFEILLVQWLEAEFGDELLIQLLICYFVSIPVVSTILLIVPWLYYAIGESSKHQATFGKRILGMKVVDTDGLRFSLMRSTGKSALQSALWLLLVCTLVSNLEPSSNPSAAVMNICSGLLLVHSLDIPIFCAIPLILSYAIIFLVPVTEQRQTWFDKLSGRLVIVDKIQNSP